MSFAIILHWIRIKMRKGSCDIKAGSVKEVSHRKEDCRKHGLGWKPLTYSHVEMYLGAGTMSCAFFQFKVVNWNNRKMFRELPTTTLAFKVRYLRYLIQVFWHHWLSRHLWVFSTSEKLSHHLCLRSFSPHKSVPAVFWSTVFYPTVKNRCVSSSHTVIPSEHGRCCEAHVLLEYK